MRKARILVLVNKDYRSQEASVGFDIKLHVDVNGEP